MNLILFEPAEIDRPLPRDDRRATHLLTVLRRKIGDTFDAGIINGPRGKATVATIGDTALTFRFAPSSESPFSTPPPPEPIRLIVGLPRPQTARDILRDATTLGVAALHFARTEKAESSYAQSTLWSSGEWRRHVLAGAEQAFVTQIPAVSFGEPLGTILATLPDPSTVAPAARIALDNYESPTALGQCSFSTANPVTLAIGAERGWSAAERALLRQHGFAFAHLGTRVLRTETAVITAVAIVRARLGLI